MHQSADVAEASFDSDDSDFAPLRCWDCNVNFTSRHFLYAHLFHHIKQPTVILNRVQLPPLKITLSKRDNSFEIVSPPKQMTNLAEEREVPEETEEEQGKDDTKLFDEPGDQLIDHEINDGNVGNTTGDADQENDDDSLHFPSDELPLSESPSQSEADSTRNPPEKEKENSNSESNTSDYGSIPGAEPTPPPEPSPEYPKIRIKTTGLLKEPLTITEITDDNPEGDANYNESGDNNSLWSTPSLEDPLKLPDNDDNILSLFNNNNERAKDLGFHTSESEFISLDRLEERNRGTMQLYNPSTSQNQSPLDSLTGLPMQALAQQVSRLQPSGNGMHQQNVLINIQQFPSGPPQPSYQPPPMYPHYPPQPMHQPYQYQPPNPLYYPPGPPGYPPQHMPPPPQPQMPQIGQPAQPSMQQQQQQQQQRPQMSQGPMHGNQMPPSSQSQQMSAPRAPQQGAGGYRQPPMQTHGPRQPGPNMRMPSGPRAPMGPRQPGINRQRAPMVRARGAGMTAVRTIRPRMPNPPNGMRPQGSPVKRSPEQLQQLQAKKKKFDILTPDKDDDDCQVICMQPKNTDGGLPQIESVQGGTSEPVENSIMHLSDSITLSVRNPPPKPVEPKKSDAKAVANILATRGITVTATAKPKEKPESHGSKQASVPPASLNLNGAVSIIPSSKSPNGTAKNSSSDPLPTVDLTEETNSHLAQNAQQKKPGLPYRCDLCPAQYPNALGLNKHRQTFHKTNSGICELGIPVINLKAPGIVQKLTSMGIHNYIPMSSNTEGFALPVFNLRNPASVANLGTTNMISLGPVRSLKPMNNAARPMPPK